MLGEVITPDACLVVGFEQPEPLLVQHLQVRTATRALDMIENSKAQLFIVALSQSISSSASGGSEFGDHHHVNCVLALHPAGQGAYGEVDFVEAECVRM